MEDLLDSRTDSLAALEKPLARKTQLTVSTQSNDAHGSLDGISYDKNVRNSLQSSRRQGTPTAKKISSENSSL